MKPTVLKTILLSAVCGVTLLGCGGGGTGAKSGLTSNAKTGSAKIKIVWPKAARLIPGTSQSIQITLTPVAVTTPAGLGAQSLAAPIAGTPNTDYVARPPATDPVTSVNTIDLYPGTYTVTATAYNVANPDTTPPAPLASGTGNLTIVAGTLGTAFSVTMTSAVTSAVLSTNASSETVFVAGTHTGGITINPAVPTQYTAELQSGSGQGLNLFPNPFVTDPISSSDGSLISELDANSISAPQSDIGGYLVVNTTGTTGKLSFLYKEADPINPPAAAKSETFDYTLTIAKVQLQATPALVTGMLPAITAVLDCATVGQGQYLYLVSDGTFHYVVTDLTAALTASEKVGATDNLLAGIPGTSTQFLTGSTTGETVDEYLGGSKIPQASGYTSLADIEFSALTNTAYALSGATPAISVVQPAGPVYTPAHSPTSTSVSVDFGSGVDAFANLASNKVYLDTSVAGTVSEVTLINSNAQAVSAANGSTIGASGALIYVLINTSNPTLQGITPNGKVVFSKQLNGLTLSGTTHLSVSSPDPTTSQISGTISTGVKTVWQF